MCDFMSYIKVKKGCITKYYYLTDDIIQAKWEESSSSPSFMEQHIGHSAIREYFGHEETEGENIESIDNLPSVIAKEINAGHMRKMIASWDKNFINPKYSMKGKLISVNGTPIKRGIAISKKYKETRFKIGDTVVLGTHAFRVDIDTGIESLNKRCDWNPNMMSYIGKLYTIKELTSDSWTNNAFIVYTTIQNWAWHMGACRLATPQEIKTLAWAK